METALLLLATSLFLVCSVLYLRVAFQSTLGWGLAGILFPPSAGLYYALDWQRLRPLALLHLASVFMLGFTLALWVRAHPYSFDGTRLAWLRDWIAPAYARHHLEAGPVQFASEQELNPYLQQHHHATGGEIDGIPVRFVRTTLVNGVLRLKSDENFFSETEVTIPLQGIKLDSGDNLLEFTPASSHPPPVYVTHYPADMGKPEISVFDHGYWMDLMLSASNNKPLYTGYIKLRLPDHKQSFLAGEFRAFTRDLRFYGDDVDLSFDSNATIEYVAEQYLDDKLGNLLDHVNGFSDTFYQTALDNPTGHTEANVKLTDGSQHQFRVDLIKGSDGWVVSDGPTAQLVAALRTMKTQPPASIQTMSVVDQASHVDPAELDKLVGKRVVILTREGDKRVGTISDVDRYNVTLATAVDGGTMGMLVQRRDIAKVELSH